MKSWSFVYNLEQIFLTSGSMWRQGGGTSDLTPQRYPHPETLTTPTVPTPQLPHTPTSKVVDPHTSDTSCQSVVGTVVVNIPCPRPPSIIKFLLIDSKI